MSQFLQFLFTGRYPFLHFTNIPYICIFIIFRVFIFNVHLYFFKQLWSELSPESCLYFQGFRGSKLLNGFLLVWQSNLAFEKSSNLLDSKSIFMICDFEFFPTMLPRQLNFGALSVSILFTFIAKEKLNFCLSVVFTVV